MIDRTKMVRAVTPDDRMLRVLFIAVGALMAGAGLAIAEAIPGWAVIWAVALEFAALSTFAFWLARQRGDHPFLVPYSALPMLFALFYGVGLLTTYYYDSFPWTYQPGVSTTFLAAKQSLPYAATLFGAGVLGMVSGALFSSRPFSILLPPIMERSEGRHFRLAALAALPIFVMSTVFSISPETPVLARHVFTLVGDFGFMLLVVAGAEIAINPSLGLRRWIAYIVAMVTLTLVVATPTGQRGHTLRPLILLGIGAVIALRRLPKSVWVTAVIAFVVLMPWLNFVKSNARQAPGVYELFVEGVADVSRQSFGERLESSLQTLGNRVFAAPYQLAMYVQTWPAVEPFDQGHTFALEMIDFVPRILFPSKGELSGELNWYAVKAGVALDPDSEGNWSSAVFDAFSEYYVNFGPWGVFLLCIIHGYYFRILYDWLVIRSSAVLFTIIYGYLVWFTLPDAGVIRRFSADSKILIIWLLIYFLMTRRATRSARLARPASRPAPAAG